MIKDVVQKSAYVIIMSIVASILLFSIILEPRGLDIRPIWLQVILFSILAEVITIEKK